MERQPGLGAAFFPWDLPLLKNHPAVADPPKEGSVESAVTGSAFCIGNRFYPRRSGSPSILKIDRIGPLGNVQGQSNLVVFLSSSTHSSYCYVDLPATGPPHSAIQTGDAPYEVSGEDAERRTITKHPISLFNRLQGVFRLLATFFEPFHFCLLAAQFTQFYKQIIPRT